MGALSIKACEGTETAKRLGREQLIFLAASPCAKAPGSTKLPCYAGYIEDITMITPEGQIDSLNYCVC